jgi:hypothetical protein
VCLPQTTKKNFNFFLMNTPHFPPTPSTHHTLPHHNHTPWYPHIWKFPKYTGIKGRGMSIHPFCSGPYCGQWNPTTAVVMKTIPMDDIETLTKKYHRAQNYSNRWCNHMPLRFVFYLTHHIIIRCILFVTFYSSSIRHQFIINSSSIHNQFVINS